MSIRTVSLAPVRLRGCPVCHVFPCRISSVPTPNAGGEKFPDRGGAFSRVVNRGNARSATVVQNPDGSGVFTRTRHQTICPYACGNKRSSRRDPGCETPARVRAADGRDDHYCGRDHVRRVRWFAFQPPSFRHTSSPAHKLSCERHVDLVVDADICNSRARGAADALRVRSLRPRRRRRSRRGLPEGDGVPKRSRHAHPDRARRLPGRGVSPRATARRLRCRPRRVHRRRRRR